jgi:radical SAM-linked protein
MTGEAFLEKLQKALPPDLPALSARPVDDRHPAPMAQLAAAIYQAELEEIPENFADTVARFTAQTEIPAIRKTKTGMKPCDIRPMIYDLSLNGDALRMTLALCEKATCKPELLLSTLFDFAKLERPHMIVTRTQMFGEKDGVFYPLEEM